MDKKTLDTNTMIQKYLNKQFFFSIDQIYKFCPLQLFEYTGFHDNSNDIVFKMQGILKNCTCLSVLLNNIFCDKFILLGNFFITLFIFTSSKFSKLNYFLIIAFIVT